MEITALSPNLAVSPQLYPVDLRPLKEAGYRAVINNRPDGEEVGQPTSTELRHAAADLGLAYRHIPIIPGQFTEADARAFAEAIAEASGPVLAFCRTGSRSTKLWEMVQRHGRPSNA